MKKAKSKKIVKIVIAICAIVVLGGAVAGVAVFGGKDKKSQPKGNTKKPEPVEEKIIGVKTNEEEKKFGGI